MPPQSHPQAQFVPIAPHFDLAALVDSTANFDYVTRLPVEKLREHSIHDFEALVLAVVIQSGKPLVIEGWGDSLPPWLFNVGWLEGNLGTKPEKVRDIPNAVDIPMTMGHYLRSMRQLTNQFSSSNYRDSKRQRLYLKDIDCPDAWADHLKQIMPESVYYLNECIEPRTGGDGAILEPNEWGQMGYGKGVAAAGDLMSSLPPEMRALNMMCYIGHEGTYTPAHREMCASLGQNIMVEASKDGNGEKGGSSIWFMTETKERELVSEYFLSMLGHDIEVEKHFAQVNAWKKAPFNVWVVEQKVGDLILIPPLAPHQVWNRGTRTMKAAWNRTTVDTLELVMHEALPRAQMVCRDEQYKNKAIIYYTLVKYYDLLQRDTVEPKMWKYGRIKQLLDDFKRLFLLYTEVLVSETFSPKLPEETEVEILPYDSNVTCSYCRCNIFNRFLTCKSCIEYGPSGEEDTYDICMDCYAMGRSCACISNLKWVEQWDWSALVQNYEEWRNLVVQSDGFFDTQRSPQPLDIARKRYGKKPIAEVCQEQLKLRPWNDIKNPTVRDLSPGMSDVEPEADDKGRPKNKKRAKFSRPGRNKVVATKDKTHTCHICFHHDWNWKLAFCTTCNRAYCYGVLWRAFDLMPQTVMEDKDWQCPKCLKICSCGKCRKDPDQKPYAPKGTLLGHDTRLVADFRSAESLVDFSRTNLVWLRGDGDGNPQDTSRMKKLKEKAEAEKARTDSVNTSYIEDGPLQQDPFVGAPVLMETSGGGSMDDIDPALRDGTELSSTTNLEAAAVDHRRPSAPMGPTANGNSQSLINGEEVEQSNEWMDGNLDLSGHTTHHNQGTPYPSGLLDADIPMSPPIALMTTAPSFYPDPSHIGQNRMMGAGYYQQSRSTTDRILYTLPDINGSVASSQPDPPQNENMALSDLLPPPVGAPDISKKRKRTGSEDEDDLEFFTSKRQRELARAKKLAGAGDMTLEVQQHHKPRRNLAQPKVYTDLGEDAVPIEEDEGLSILASRWRKPREPNGGSGESTIKEKYDVGKQAAKSNSVSPPTRRSARSLPESSTGSPAELPADNRKAGRKSSWLARKNAQESGDEFLNELHARKRRSCLSAEHRSSLAIEILPASGENKVDRGANVDSLFGEPLDNESSVESSDKGNESDGGGEVKEPSPKTHTINMVADGDTNHDDLPIPKRRGRPPKAPPQYQSSPEPSNSPSAPRLSLKEKLALRGNNAPKIVAAKRRNGIENKPDTLGSRPSPKRQRILRSPSLGTSIDEGMTENHPVSRTARVNGTRTTAVEAIRKGPTVVRLASPDPESASSYGDVSDTPEVSLPSTSHDSSDSDASIPATPAQAKRPRGRPSLASMGRSVLSSNRGTARVGRGRGRGRGRPRGRGRGKTG